MPSSIWYSGKIEPQRATYEHTRRIRVLYGSTYLQRRTSTLKHIHSPKPSYENMIMINILLLVYISFISSHNV